MKKRIRYSGAQLVLALSIGYLYISTSANAKSDDDCSVKEREFHSRKIMQMVRSMLSYNPKIKSQEALVDSASKQFLARKTFYYPNFKLDIQPLVNYVQTGYSDTGLVGPGNSSQSTSGVNPATQYNSSTTSPSTYLYRYNQLMNYTAQIEADIFNLPKFNLMQSSWNQLKSAQESLSDTVDNTGLKLLDAYITAQSLKQALDDEQKVVAVYKKYTETQLQLLNKGFGSILEYNNQLGSYLTYQSRVNSTHVRFQEALDEIYEIAGVKLDENDFFSLPSPSCLAPPGNINELSPKIRKYYQPIQQNLYNARSYTDLALSETNQYLPKLSLGYALSYYKQYGNITGSSGQTYTQLNSYPYLKLSLAFNLGGREYYESSKYRLLAESFLEQSRSAQDQAQRELAVNLTNFKYHTLNYFNNRELKQQSLETIRLTQGAMLTGLIDFSLFLNSQSLLFLGIENESSSLISAYKSYMRVKRLTSSFIEQVPQILFQD